MKEVEIVIGIILIVIGGIIFEMGQSYTEESMNWGNLIKLFGLVLVSVGVVIYVLVVDSIDETKKEIKKKGMAKWMLREKKYMRASINLDKDYKKKLTYLAELEHRNLNQQIVHMAEYYLKHEVEIRILLEQFTNQYELGKHGTSSSYINFIDKKTRSAIEVKTPHRVKTSQVLQDNKGFIESDVPQKKAKMRYESLSSWNVKALFFFYSDSYWTCKINDPSITGERSSKATGMISQKITTLMLIFSNLSAGGNIDVRIVT